MSLLLEIQKKPQELEKRSLSTSKDVFELEEVQEIKDAVQEHLLFIGLDSRNNIRNISLLAMGNYNCVSIDSKIIVRKALLTASEKVILVHNHPSNNLLPSDDDKHITNVTKKLLEAFNIELTDHVIVIENNYISMEKLKSINKDYEDDKIKLMDKVLLIEESSRLKEQVNYLTNKLKKKEKLQENEFEEEEF